jgi:hypothetical protein
VSDSTEYVPTTEAIRQNFLNAFYEGDREAAERRWQLWLAHYAAEQRALALREAAEEAESHEGGAPVAEWLRDRAERP